MEKFGRGSYIEGKTKKFVLREDNHCFAYAQLEQWCAVKSHRTHNRAPSAWAFRENCPGGGWWSVPIPGNKKRLNKFPGATLRLWSVDFGYRTSVRTWTIIYSTMLRFPGPTFPGQFLDDAGIILLIGSDRAVYRVTGTVIFCHTVPS